MKPFLGRLYSIVFVSLFFFLFACSLCQWVQSWVRGSFDSYLPSQFEFDFHGAGLRASLGRLPCECTAQEVFLRGVVLQLKRNNQVFLELDLNWDSALTCDDERIYVVESYAKSPGGKVVAYSLADGGKLWENELSGMMSWRHSFYQNRVRVDIENGFLQVFGRESNGDYVQMFHRATGFSVARKVYSIIDMPLNHSIK